MRTPAPTTSTTTSPTRRSIHRGVAFGASALMLAGAGAGAGVGLASAAPAQAAGGAVVVASAAPAQTATDSPIQLGNACREDGAFGTAVQYYVEVFLTNTTGSRVTYTLTRMELRFSGGTAQTYVSPTEVPVDANSTKTIIVTTGNLPVGNSGVLDLSYTSDSGPGDAPRTYYPFDIRPGSCKF